jgi:hypothetical protein
VSCRLIRAVLPNGGGGTFDVELPEPVAACTEADLEPNPNEKALLAGAHKCGQVEGNVATLCVAPSGAIIGDVPDFKEDQLVRVRFFRRSNSDVGYDFDVRFERSVVSGPLGKFKPPYVTLKGVTGYEQKNVRDEADVRRPLRARQGLDTLSPRPRQVARRASGPRLTTPGEAVRAPGVEPNHAAAGGDRSNDEARPRRSGRAVPSIVGRTTLRRSPTLLFGMVNLAPGGEGTPLL